MAYTPGPWREGLNGACIVSDTPIEGAPLGANDNDCLKFYGGYLIAESVAKCNRPLLIAAPNLYEALENALGFIEELKNHGIDQWSGEAKVRAALRKARGEAS